MSNRSPDHNAKIAASLKSRGAGASATKRCPACDTEKPRTDFGLRKNGYSRSLCRDCERAASRAHHAKAGAIPEVRERRREQNRAHKFRTKYGITLEDYDAMLSEQEGGCGICGRSDPGPKSQFFLFVDHCHEGGDVRGLLCHYCNIGIGAFFDDADVMRKAIKYIEAWKGDDS